MKRKNILLVYPFPKKPKIFDIALKLKKRYKSKVPVPLSIMAIAGELVSHGYGPIIFDYRINNCEDLYEILNENEIVCVGISCMTGSSIMGGLEVAKTIRAMDRNIPIVWGGVHPTLKPEQTIQAEEVDIVVVGEGEETFIELVKCLEHGGDIGTIRGIYYKEDGKVIKNPERSLFDIEKSSRIPYELLSPKYYSVKENLQYESSRGCPYRCKFCDVLATHRKTWKAKSADKVIGELEEITHSIEPKFIQIVDDNFFINSKRVVTICEGILSKNLNFQWSASCRADRFAKFDDDFISLIKRAGCNMILVGAESGSQRILDVMGKGITVEEIIETSERSKRFGIRSTYTFMAGVPGETQTDVDKTLGLIEYITTNNPYTVVSGLILYSPLPGTPWHDLAIRNGFVPPSTLEEWGMFRQNRFANIPWHNAEYLKKLEPLCLMSRWGFLDMSFGNDVLKPLIRLSIGRATFNSIRLLYRLRIKRNFYSFPIDIKLGKILREYIYQAG